MLNRISHRFSQKIKSALSLGLCMSPLFGALAGLPALGQDLKSATLKTAQGKSDKEETTLWISKYNVLVKSLDAEIITGYLAKPRTVSQAQFKQWRSSIKKASTDLQSLPVPPHFTRLNQLINQIVKHDQYLCYHLAVVPKVPLSQLSDQELDEYSAKLKKIREINFKMLVKSKECDEISKKFGGLPILDEEDKELVKKYLAGKMGS